MISRSTVEECLPLVEHLKAVGETAIELTRVYRYNQSLSEEAFDKSLPWELVSKVTTGGGVRWGVEIDLRFEAVHPSGLTFSWSYYIENRDNPYSVQGGPTLDFENIKKVIVRLPRDMQLEVQKILKNNVAAMQKQACEAWDYYTKVSNSAVFAKNFVASLVD